MVCGRSGVSAFATNGTHISAVGDHEGANGTSYLFEYNPASRNLTRFMDVLSLVEHQPGAWGYGKIHSQMVADTCGSVWVFTYWGSRRGLEYGNGYEGDLLLEIATQDGLVVNHGPVAGQRGVPSLIGTAGGAYLVGEAVDPETRDGDLVIVDGRFSLGIVDSLQGPNVDAFISTGSAESLDLIPRPKVMNQLSN